MEFTRPNILVLLTDQQRFDTLRALGSSFAAETPAMDSLVREGISFENAFCTAPVCSPSRSTLLTGLYPTQAGIPGNLSASVPPLSPALPTVGKLMRAAGYQTAYHGKWHLGGRIQDHGFELAEECSHDETTRLLASRFWKDRDWENHDRPFFQIVSFLNPHDHYFYDPANRVPGFQRQWKNAGRKKTGMSQAAIGKQVDWPEEQWGAYFRFYEQLIERVDRDIAETLHHLRCSGFFGNTWIIFASDHGDMAGEHDLPFKGPLMFDGVARVPLVLVPPQTRFSGPPLKNFDPEAFPLGRRSQLCSLIDLVPTILDLAGADIPSSLPGKSLLPLLRDPGQEAPHEWVFSEWHQPGIRMVRSREWKYVLHQNGEEELYDLRADAAELHNVADAPTAATAKARLASALRAHLQATGDPFAPAVNPGR